MPEIAEVEAVRQKIDQTLKGRKIREVVVDPHDRFLFAFAPAKKVESALLGAKITGTGRKGKYFWIELDRKPWPIFHLGMTGNISLLQKKSQGHERIWGGVHTWEDDKLDESRLLWFCRLLLTVDKKVEMALIDPRRFARMWLADDPWTHPRIARLGFDPLLDFPKPPVLAERLKKRKKSIKSVLLDQSLFAGVGNWLADEILFQSKISPHRIAAQLSLAEVKTLHAKTLSVVKKAVAVNADYVRFPKSWLFHVRWGKKKNAKTSQGHKIVHEEIGGRTSAWVPGWQV